MFVQFTQRCLLVYSHFVIVESRGVLLLITFLTLDAQLNNLISNQTKKGNLDNGLIL